MHTFLLARFYEARRQLIVRNDGLSLTRAVPDLKKVITTCTRLAKNVTRTLRLHWELKVMTATGYIEAGTLGSTYMATIVLCDC